MAKGLFQLAAKRKEGEARPVLVTLGFGLCEFFLDLRQENSELRTDGPAHVVLTQYWSQLPLILYG